MNSVWSVGYQTIVFGPRIEEDQLPGVLDGIAAAGFKGVEFWQRPKTLPDHDELLSMLEKRNLELLGLTGGSLQERMKYCGDNHFQYLYVEEWDPLLSPQAGSKLF